MTKRLPPVEEQRRRAERKKHRAEIEARALALASRTLADQALVHFHESAALCSNYIAMQDALRGAVGLLAWIRDAGAGSWTPANTAQLEEWRELCRLAGSFQTKRS